MLTPQSDAGCAGIARARRRGGAASWASLAAVAGCGGVRERNLAAHVGWEAWADSPAIGHGTEKKRVFQNMLLAYRCHLCPVYLDARASTSLDHALHQASCGSASPRTHGVKNALHFPAALQLLGWRCFRHCPLIRIFSASEGVVIGEEGFVRAEIERGWGSLRSL